MTTSASRTDYDPIAKTLHWGMAAIWITVWCLGILAVYWRDTLNPDHGLTIAHKALAISLVGLIVVRIGWRLTHKPPPLAANMSPLMQRAAHAGHIALYAVALLALPLSGWVWSSVADKPIMLLWLVDVPPLLDPAPAYYDLAKWVHVTIAWAAGLLVAGHALIALKHHFIDRDHTLRSMLPRH